MILTSVCATALRGMSTACQALSRALRMLRIRDRSSLPCHVVRTGSPRPRNEQRSLSRAPPAPTVAGNSAEWASSMEANVVQQLGAPRQEEGTQRSPPALPAPLRSDTRHFHSRRLRDWSRLHGHMTPPEVGSVRSGGTRGIEPGSISGDAQPPPPPCRLLRKGPGSHTAPGKGIRLHPASCPCVQPGDNVYRSFGQRESNRGDC